MSTEEILQIRWKVIADYPKSNWKIGDIVLGIYCEGLYRFEDYPHLFKKLEWWEDRKIEDLPEYLKDEFETYTDYYEVLKYHLNLGTVDVINNKYGLLEDQFIETFKPSTKEEYEANNNV